MSEDFEIRKGILEKYHGSDAHVVIPDGVTEIGSRAFKGCQSITSVTIPDSVREIGIDAFSQCSNLASVSIPDSVREIGIDAFSQCSNLTDVSIPDSVTKIGTDAFLFCTNLTSVHLPNALTEIRWGTFRGCEKLVCVNIPDGVETIGDWAFSQCESLASIDFPNRLFKIGEHAFDGCKSLTSLIIPQRLSKIAMGAFSHCESLTELIIPDGVFSIHYIAFSSCKSLTSVTIPDSVTKILDRAFEFCPHLTVICGEGSCAHRYCQSHQITYIFDYQFKAFHGFLPPGFEMLPSPFSADEEKPFIFISYSHKDRDRVLSILKTLYEKGWKIWYDEGLTIGDSYDETLEAHIKNCSAFLLFVTENSAGSNYIRKNEVPWAIRYEKPIIKCMVDDGTDYAIKEGSVAATVPPGGIESALETISGLTKGAPREAKGISIVIDPANRNEAEGDGFAYCLYARESADAAKAILLEARNSGCTLYDAVENGDDEAKLQNCASLIVFLDNAFLSDERLRNILTDAYQAGRDIAVCRLEDFDYSDFPEDLIELDKMHGLNFVHGITPDMNKKLAQHLQKRGCRNTATLPGFEYEKTDKGIVIKRYTGLNPHPRIESEYGGVPVVEIAEAAFKNCLRLKSITIPDSVTQIGKNAFEGCVNLTAAVVGTGVRSIDYSVFKDCSSLVSISLPDNLTEIGSWSFLGCTSLSSVVLPDNVTLIRWRAFENCSSLTSINIPHKVKFICDDSFKGCTGLTSIDIPNSVKIIDTSAFEDCTNLKSVTIPNSATKIGSAAFAGCPKLTVICTPNSCAWKYCKKYNIRVKTPRSGFFGKLFGKKNN